MTIIKRNNRGIVKNGSDYPTLYATTSIPLLIIRMYTNESIMQ
jgi:hypothetical protein